MGYSDLFYYKSPSLVGVVVKALEGQEERHGLDLRRWPHWVKVEINRVCPPPPSYQDPCGEILGHQDIVKDRSLSKRSNDHLTSWVPYQGKCRRRVVHCPIWEGVCGMNGDWGAEGSG